MIKYYLSIKEIKDLIHWLTLDKLRYVIDDKDELYIVISYLQEMGLHDPLDILDNIPSDYSLKLIQTFLQDSYAKEITPGQYSMFSKLEELTKKFEKLKLNYMLSDESDTPETYALLLETEREISELPLEIPVTDFDEKAVHLNMDRLKNSVEAIRDTLYDNHSTIEDIRDEFEHLFHYIDSVQDVELKLVIA